MDKLLLEIPTHLETERLYLRCYEPGDGPWYYAMSLKNRTHLQEFESGNAVMSIQRPEDAEILIRKFAVSWISRDCFYLGAFEKDSDEFVAQIYIGPLNWNLPEFEIGYFVDNDHEGKGFVTEAVKASLGLIFEHLQARRVSLCCNPKNVRSVRVAERCGFVREGYVRENFQNKNGAVSDTLCYGILKREYESTLKEENKEKT